MAECSELLGSQSTVGRFRSKPEEVLAIQWTGANWNDVRAFLGEAHCCEGHEAAFFGPLTIKNESGTLLTARVGDWVIRDQAGFFRPCPANVFSEIFEPVSNTKR